MEVIFENEVLWHIEHNNTNVLVDVFSKILCLFLMSFFCWPERNFQTIFTILGWRFSKRLFFALLLLCHSSVYLKLANTFCIRGPTLPPHTFCRVAQSRFVSLPSCCSKLQGGSPGPAPGCSELPSNFGALRPSAAWQKAQGPLMATGTSCFVQTCLFQNLTFKVSCSPISISALLQENVGNLQGANHGRRCVLYVRSVSNVFFSWIFI